LQHALGSEVGDEFDCLFALVDCDCPFDERCLSHRGSWERTLSFLVHLHFDRDVADSVDSSNHLEESFHGLVLVAAGFHDKEILDWCGYRAL